MFQCQATKGWTKTSTWVPIQWLTFPFVKRSRWNPTSLSARPPSVLSSSLLRAVGLYRHNQLDKNKNCNTQYTLKRYFIHIKNSPCEEIWKGTIWGIICHVRHTPLYSYDMTIIMVWVSQQFPLPIPGSSVAPFLNLTWVTPWATKLTVQRSNDIKCLYWHYSTWYNADPMFETPKNTVSVSETLQMGKKHFTFKQFTCVEKYGNKKNILYQKIENNMKQIGKTMVKQKRGERPQPV